MAFSPRGTCHRPTVTGRRGMITSAHPLASVAGLRILMAGGNAVDAAIATAAALNVVEPFMSGLGGIGYMNIYNASRNEHQILDYVGLTPRAAELSSYTDEDQINSGPMSPIVPGACGGWLAALERYGTMDAATVFEPAIEYAEQGFGMTATGSRFFGAAASGLRPSSAATYLFDGRAPQPGEVLVQADLAQTYRAIAADGPDVFYRGAIADKIVSYMRDSGGLLTHEDLADFTPAWLDPVDIDYRGFRICVPPPPCQAVQYLQTLNIMEGFDVGEMGHNSSATLHTFLEAAKLAIADRVEYAAIAEPPTAGLLSKAYATQRRALIGDRAQPRSETYVPTGSGSEVGPGDPYAWMKTECTTHFDAIDDRGNAVSVTQSLGSSFGSGMVVPGTGLALNNFMRWFDMNPQSPNAIAPAKKNEMCMSPVQVFDDAGLRFLIGTPGSYGIMQTTPQMIMNIIDHRMNIQAAIEAPRVRSTQGLEVIAETRIDGDVLAELEAKGHRLVLDGGDWTPAVGGGQGIYVDADTGTFVGGADPRRDGYAVGW
jgi:gamma-glutamyltranspeptidase/glutathione hydrolase